ncbi:hypothetical protein [Microbacterium stercoris]|uniref:Uncharacterized protein n=1 Tax=Microbacterium stercoris TaxID=2820289 RepID=A0A939QQQ6_9MICO|nr:hypothetical protein [Microbacterium stercoris]MBO3663741.1 hypothetical protein [Microbacterium stercoris]
MKSSTTAALVGVLALAAVGGGAAYAMSQPAPAETTNSAGAQTPTPTPTESATPEASEPTPAAGSAPSVTPDQETCRDYVASKWQNAEYPAERETDWATEQSADGGLIVTWKLDGSAAKGGPGGSTTRDYTFTCTLAADGSLVEVLAG